MYELHKRFVLEARVLHAEETPVALLDPGAGKTRKAYVWAYARSRHDRTPGVVYDFCRGRGAQHPVAFLAGDERRGVRRWDGTLLTDRYQAYELAKAKTSPLADAAIVRFARIYQFEADLVDLSDDERRTLRQRHAQPLWEELQAWLELERRRVLPGSAAAGAIDYTLKHWVALTHHLDDGAVAIDNNHLERQIKPWAMGRKAWMDAGG